MTLTVQAKIQLSLSNKDAILAHHLKLRLQIKVEGDDSLVPYDLGLQLLVLVDFKDCGDLVFLIDLSNSISKLSPPCFHLLGTSLPDDRDCSEGRVRHVLKLLCDVHRLDRKIQNHVLCHFLNLQLYI